MNPLRSSRAVALRLGSVVALAAMAFMTPTIAAQEAAESAHPAHIHSGTCDALGDVVNPLSDVAIPEGESSGPASAQAVKLSETVVDMPLQDIIAGGHAINVHQSAEEIDVYIACGDIGGVLQSSTDDDREELRIGLTELNDSGHVGVAWLGADGDQTRVSVMMLEPSGMSGDGAGAAQEATPAADASAATSAVEIKDFTYNPPTIEVPVGGSVTWTNQDNAPHTATALEREVLQSGPIAFGESFTQTFDTAGTFDYFCEFHANMKGSIVVE